MIRTTPYPNILWVSCPVEPWGNHSPETYRASLVALMEITPEATRLWYVHHLLEARLQSGKGDWERPTYHPFPLTESMKGVVSHHVMQEYWRTYVNPEVLEIHGNLPEEIPDDVLDAVKRFKEASKRTG